MFHIKFQNHDEKRNTLLKFFGKMKHGGWWGIKSKTWSRFNGSFIAHIQTS